MNKKRKVLFIINPISGGKNVSGFKDLVKENLDLRHFDFEIYKTTARGDATIKTKESRDNFDIIIAVGGDGTINEIAQELLGSNTSLAVIPKGSGNGFVNYFQLPLEPAAAIKTINKFNNHKIDTATFNGQFFLSVAGLGFDATVAHAFDHFGTRGFFSYARLAMREFLKFKPAHYEIKIDGKRISQTAFLVTIANSNQYGNKAYISPKARIDDGLLDLVIIKPINLFQSLILAWKLFNKSVDKSRYCTIIRGKEIEIISNDQHAHLDGEPCDSLHTNKIQVSPQSLNMIV